MITQKEYEKVQNQLESITTKKELVEELQSRMSKDNLSKRVVNDFINHFVDIVTSPFNPIQTNVDKVTISGLGTFTTKKVAGMKKGKGILKEAKKDIPERRKPVVKVSKTLS
jgi:nucleoid DNA-binding protein